MPSTDAFAFPWGSIAAIGTVAFLINIPLGFIRDGCRRYSAGWFLCIHAAIPLIAWLRISKGITPWAIPAFLAATVAGQFAGGRIRRRKERPR